MPLEEEVHSKIALLLRACNEERPRGTQHGDPVQARKTFTRNRSGGTLLPDFPASSSVRNLFLSFQPAGWWCSIQQHKQNKTKGRKSKAQSTVLRATGGALMPVGSRDKPCSCAGFPVPWGPEVAGLEVVGLEGQATWFMEGCPGTGRDGQRGELCVWGFAHSWHHLV